MAGEEGRTITWRLHLRAPPHVVYAMLATNTGRARWWAESAVEWEGVVHFRFANGWTWYGKVLANLPPRRFSVTYINGTLLSFDLADDGHGGTEVVLTETGLSDKDHEQNLAGWVAVLLALKAAVDHEVDLRNHDPQRTWEQGYVDG